ncbi:MAG: gas vesicle protein [Acidobacteria bacterium]|nr:gas vesicle protein [Acidobacteriota bacterium]
MQLFSREADDQISLIDVLDHVLNQGIVIRGSLVISLAGVDLVYLGLDAILTSVETAMQHLGTIPPGARRNR